MAEIATITIILDGKVRQMRKSILLLLCVLALLTFVSCATVPFEDSEEAQMKAYAPILEQYEALLRSKQAGDLLALSEDSTDQLTVKLYQIVEKCENVTTMGYATKDINEDGLLELVLLSKDSRPYALFTLKDQKPVLLTGTDIVLGGIYPNGQIYACTPYVPGADQGFSLLARIVDGELTGLEFGVKTMDGQGVYYKVEDGAYTELTSEDYRMLDNYYTSAFMQCHSATKESGFRFVPVLEDESADSSAPQADFSTYDGILSAYKRIVESQADYTEQKWLSGEYDSLFTFADNTAYEIFNHIFMTSINQRPTTTYWGTEYMPNANYAYGYAKKDLNGDGMEELILMTDNYRILAIFTIKDGRAVWLKGVSLAWIGEDGYVRTERSAGIVTTRDGEYFIYQLVDGAWQQVVGVGCQVNAFLERVNWYTTDGHTQTSISDQEGEDLLAQYDILPVGCTQNEYTKTHAGLPFIPLFEVAQASTQHEGTYRQMGIINGDNLTIASVSDSVVSFVFSYVKASDEDDVADAYEKEISAHATLTDGVYVFQQDGVEGYLAFTVDAVWLVVTQSQDSQVDCRAYLFDYPLD